MQILDPFLRYNFQVEFHPKTFEVQDFHEAATAMQTSIQVCEDMKTVKKLQLQMYRKLNARNQLQISVI